MQRERMAARSKAVPFRREGAPTKRTHAVASGSQWHQVHLLLQGWQSKRSLGWQGGAGGAAGPRCKPSSSSLVAGLPLGRARLGCRPNPVVRGWQTDSSMGQQGVAEAAASLGRQPSASCLEGCAPWPHARETMPSASSRAATVAKAPEGLQLDGQPHPVVIGKRPERSMGQQRVANGEPSP